MEIGVRKAKTQGWADRVEVAFRNKDENNMEWSQVMFREWRVSHVCGVKGACGVGVS